MKAEALWLAYLAGDLDPAGDERLARLLEDDPHILAAVLADLETETLLTTAAVDDTAFMRGIREHLKATGDGTRFNRRLRQRIGAHQRGHWWAAAGLVAAASMVAALGLLRSDDPEPVHPPPPAAATQELASGETHRLSLSDTALLIHGPARYRQDAEGFSLFTGRVDCAVVPGRDGFRLRTPHATVEVLGTRFQVAADEHTSHVMVEQGRVQVRREDGATLEIGAGLAVDITSAGPLVPRLERPGVATVIAADPDTDSAFQALRAVLEADGWQVHGVEHRIRELPADTELVIPLQPASSSAVRELAETWSQLPVLCLDPSINRWIGISADRNDTWLDDSGGTLLLTGSGRACLAGLAGRVEVQASRHRLRWSEALPGIETLATWADHPERGVMLLHPRLDSQPPRLFLGINPAGDPNAAGWALLRASASWLVAESRAAKGR